MPNSLLTGVTGLRAHQQMLDVTGNNLANSNTTGFKAQRIRFSDLVYQTLSPGAGGINPQQIGLGVKIAAIDVNLQQGTLENTQNTFDLALQGNGYFVASDGLQNQFTRAGAFGVDANNFLVDPANGYRVQRFGTLGEGTATSPAFQLPGENNIRIPLGSGIPGQGTSEITLQGNLSANAIGPLAQVLTTTQAFRAGGTPATLATLLNNLDDNPVNYIAGDQLSLQGMTHAGAAVNATLAAGPATTVGDVITAINANFPGSSASLDLSGNIVVTSGSQGPSSLDVRITDAPGNTGATTWGNHIPAITTAGKDGDRITTGIEFFDTQGTSHFLSLEFQKQGNNLWDLRAAVPSDGVVIDGQVNGITFNDDGSFRLVSGTGLGDSILSIQINGLGAPQNMQLNFGTANAFDGITQVGGASSAVATNQDGFAAGFLSNVAVLQDGVVNGIFTNGRVLPIAQLAIASFANPGALLRGGDNYLGLSTESGTALIGGGLSGGRGAILQKNLESSNVDVALEFTRLIIAQRGFQVNARTITVSDQVLEELANIIR